MATYKYQQNVYEGSSEGYVQYNITPDFGTVLAVGETFEITGKMYAGYLKRYGVVVEAGIELNDYGFLVTSRELGRVEQECAKGRSVTFSVTCEVTQALANLTDDRAFKPYLQFVLADAEDLYSGAGTVSVEGQQLSALGYRLAPVVNAVTVNDTTGAFDYFGGAVEGKSDLSFALDLELDPGDNSVELVEAMIDFGGNLIYLSSDKISDNVISVGKLNFNGAFESFLLSVIDNKGKLGTYIGDGFTVYPYSPPTIFALMDSDVAERYSLKISDTGEEIPTADEAGNYVWTTFQASITPINGRNFWTVRRSYAQYGYTLPEGTVCLHGDDGTELAVWQNTGIFSRDITFDANKKYTIELVVSDFFEEVTLVFDLEKAGGYFNVEKYGVAAGMRSTATENNPLLESAYPISGYGGINGVNNHVEGEENTYGTWLDGKRIYRTVVPVTVSTINTVVNVATIEDAETIVRIDGCYVDAAGAAYPPAFFLSTSNYIATYYSNNALNVKTTRAVTGYAAIYYTKALENADGTPAEKTVVRPAAAMTSYSSQGCVVTYSTEYSSRYAAWKAFDKSYSNAYGWASANGTSDGWLQLEMDVALRKIAVTIINRTFTYVNGPETGIIYGSNDGVEWTSLATFKGRDGNTSALKTVHECNNEDMSYKYIRVYVARSEGYVSVGEIVVEGVEGDAQSSGGTSKLGEAVLGEMIIGN